MNSATLPAWKNGYLDIHHINTGRGDCTFCIFPDGTTLLIDAGENSRIGERIVCPKPNASISAGKCIVDYINEFIPNHKNYIDYYLITHYHSDHIGGIYKKRNQNNRYYLTGITEVFEYLPAKKIIDRGFNMFTPASNDSCYANYKDFIACVKPTINHETFKIGSCNQIRVNDSLYHNFKITNIYANGIILKETNRIDTLFFDKTNYTTLEKTRENMYSCVLKLEYGNFSYYTGGDIPGYPRIKRPLWHDIETPVSKVVGNVNIVVLNHHGNGDGTNVNFLENLQPDNIIITGWDALHPENAVLSRCFSKDIYPKERNVLSTNLHPATRVVIGKQIDNMASTQGHIVIRVEPNGKCYNIYVLDDNCKEKKIIKVLGPFKCEQK